MMIDVAILSPMSALLGALIGGGASVAAGFTRNAVRTAFNESRPRSQNERQSMGIS
jgi:hypothetical protein